MASAPTPGTAHKLFVKAASTSGGPSASGCPVSQEERDRWLAAQQREAVATAGASGCPASEEARHAARINMPVVPNEASSTSGQPAGSLSTQRLASSIPIADPSSVPKHQQGAAQAADGSENPVWMYPSEQQFYNAMARKGWQPDEGDMPTVVAIHNAVNERAWQHILFWESMHACDCPMPKLLRFKGRPNEFSPKARLLNLLGYKLPFDRHDWVVDRCGQEVRYVIDFYSGPPVPGVQASMHLDVRPALDSFGAALDRIRMQWRWVASGRWREQ